MKSVLTSAFLIFGSVAAMAAPSGQATCRGTNYGKQFTFSYGLYAESGGAKLTIKEKGKQTKSFELDGKSPNDESQNLTFVAKAGNGTVSWVGGGDEGVDAAVLTVKIDSDNSYQLILPCKVTKLTSDSMAN